jgi:hypothetical protein
MFKGEQVSHLFLRLFILAAALLWITNVYSQAASTVTLAWDPSPGTNIAGYNIYYGGATRDYTNTITVLNTNEVQVTNLVSGTTYFFAATAFDFQGLESDYSDEVSTALGISNQPPAISAISNMIVTLGSPIPPIPFTISDAETPPDQLALSFKSDNETLISTNGISSNGSGADRTLALSPNPAVAGSATITVTVNDGTNTATSAFQLTVQPASRPQMVMQEPEISGNSIILRWNSVPGHTYQLQYATDLTIANWQDLGQPLTANDTMASAVDTPGTDLVRFYRVGESQ